MLPIAKISISKFMSIEELEFSPTAITIFKGKNGRGKTSVTQAILAAFKGAKGMFVRDGETEARVLIELTNDTVLDRRIAATGKQKPLRIKPGSAPVVGNPAAWLAENVDELINPLDFITAPPDKRERWLLEALPVKVTVEELSEACAGTMPPAELIGLAAKHGLLAIDEAHTRLYDARTEANVTARAKRAAISQLEASLPPLDEEATDWRVIEDELASQMGAIDGRLQSGQRAATREAEMEKTAATSEFNAERSRIQFELKAAITAAENKARQDTAEAERKKANRIRAAEIEEATVKSNLTEAVANERQQVADSLGEARAKREESDRSVNTRNIMDGFGVEAVELERRWAAFNAAIENLAGLKNKLLDRLPIQGIETKGGRLFRAGLPFEMLNTAQCMDIAMEVAELRAGKIGLVCVDGIERLDSEAKQAWFERARNSGLQFFFTERTDDPVLTVVAG